MSEPIGCVTVNGEPFKVFDVSKNRGYFKCPHKAHADVRREDKPDSVVWTESGSPIAANRPDLVTVAGGVKFATYCGSCFQEWAGVPVEEVNHG